MNIRFALTALLATVSLPALATSGFTPGVGEAGGSTDAMPRGKTRAQVVQELSDWRRDPVTSEGWKEVGGEAGWVYVGTDRSAHDLRAAAGTTSTPADVARPEASPVAGIGSDLARRGHLSSTVHRGHR